MASAVAAERPDPADAAAGVSLSPHVPDDNDACDA